MPGMKSNPKSEYRDEIIRAQSSTPIMDPEECWKSLEAKILAGNITMDMGRVRDAYEYAVKLHEGQKRRDGSPYVTHCVATAEIIAEQGLDEDSIVAALLHDVIEDTPATYDDVKRQFGATVADIVEGVTKLTRVQYTSHEEEQAENLRKMLIAMAKDIRVILIKIADRLHNMRTMDYQSKEKQLIKSAETMEIYAPIAHRLGMQKIKWELEDRSLYYLDREGYKEITEALSTRMDTLRVFMDKVEKQIQKRMDDEGIDATVYGRIKHIYSIYRKMFAQQLDINGIFDLCAFRVIVDSIPDCYNALGMIHDMYKPVPGRFKDYVSTPKPNGYQSVHTTVIGSEGIPFEVQIRTWDMHLTAEYGVAAHWKYKTGEQGVKEGDEEKFAWVRRLLEAQQETDATEFVHDLKIDMFADEVFVFTPSGRRHKPPSGRDAHRLRLRHTLRRRQQHGRRLGQRAHRHLRPRAAKRRHRRGPHLQERAGPEPRLAAARQELQRAHQDKAVVQKGEARGEHPARPRHVRDRAQAQRPHHGRRPGRGRPAAHPP